MRLLTTIVAVICASLAHAAHLAPWNPDGDGARVGLSANGGGVVACRVSSSGVESFSCDLAGNLLSASNSVAAETFAYDGTWNLASELMASNPNFRNAGVQNAVYQAVVDEWGSPLKRLGAYDNAPFVMESEIVDAVWDLGAATTAYKNLGVRTVTYSSTAQKSGVILVTPQGVALHHSEKYRIPDSYVDNPYRSGSYGERINGRFIERVRIDPPTPPGKNGPSYSHYHLNGGHEHLSPRNRNDPGFSQ